MRQPEAGGRFPATRWSLVLAAGGDGEASARALEAWCAIYRRPVLLFIRAQGFGEADAEDLTQEFFLRLVDRDLLRRADPGRGRLRTFLAASLRNFLANARERAEARKRGGGWQRVEAPLTEAEAELPPGPGLAPDRSFDRQWALFLLQRVLARLGEEYARSGRGDVFEALQPGLSVEAAPRSMAVLARDLDLSEGAVRVAAFRLRRRYRELLVAEVAQTVGEDVPAEDELRALLDTV